MPQRTNAFQQVVLIIQRQLSAGALVIESAMLRDRDTEQDREVDVVIDGQLAGRRVIVSLECRAHKRPQTVTWVEEMHAKHSRLSTNLLVLVSQSGFTKAAIVKAKSLGIETVQPQYFTGDRAERIAARLSGVSLHRLVVTDLAQRVTVRIDGDDETQSVLLRDNNTIHAADGSVLDQAGLAARRLVYANFAKFGEVTSEPVYFELVCDPFRLIKGEEREIVYLQNAAIDRTLFPIDTFTAEGTICLEDLNISLRHGELEGAEFSQGEGSFGDQGATVVATYEGTPHVHIRLHAAEATRRAR